MKQFVVATLSLAGLLAPGIGAAQSSPQCMVVCNPPRVYCVPPGTPFPPIYSMCKTSYKLTSGIDLSVPADEGASSQPACTAQQVFNEETQSYEWQMGCD